MTAITAYALLMTLGINTHIDFANYGYQNLSTVETNIHYLGVHIIRDSPQNQSDIASWLEVANATGAKFDAYVSETSIVGMLTNASFFSALNSEHILAAIEGGNEEDDAYPASLGNTVAATAAFQQSTMWVYGKSFHLPVINMSFGSGWTATNNWIGDYSSIGDLSAFCTFGNAHTYPQLGQTPSFSIQYVNGLAKMAASTKPVATTEIGWSTAIFTPTLIAKYVLDTVLDGALYGSPAMYFYGLYDDGSGNWGLFNADGTTRPSAVALHNLTDLLSNNATSSSIFTPGTFAPVLTGTITGDSSQVIAKSNGIFFLALWNEDEAADTTHPVTVTFPSTVVSVKLFDPLIGTKALTIWKSVSSVSAPVPDHPILLEVVTSNQKLTSRSLSRSRPSNRSHK